MTTTPDLSRRLWRRFSLHGIAFGAALLGIAALLHGCSSDPKEAAPAPTAATAATTSPVLPSPATPSSPTAPATPSTLAIAALSNGADMLLVNGQVYTVDSMRSWAEAVAIKDGRIVWVGNNAEHTPWLGANTQLIDLQGRMVLPGFQDAHTHPVASGVSYLQCALFDIKDLDALLAKVQQCAAEKPEAQWIVGGGWLMDNFPNGLPDKKLLDAIVPNRPVALESSDGHSLWVNSKALSLAGITRTTLDPAGGRIDRYRDSREPSGALQEPAAMNLVVNQMPAISEQEKLDGLLYARDLMHSLGITAVQDASVKLTPNDAYSGLAAYRTLAARGELQLHVIAALHWQAGVDVAAQLPAFEEARDFYSHGEVRANTIKIFQDGVLETHTGALLAPYIDRSDGYSGELLNSQSALNTAVLALDGAGFQLHFHAIGDLAIRSSLDALELARKENGARDSRHHIAHIELFDPADIPRFKTLDVVANFQPLWAMNDSYITELTVPIIGTERGRWLYPIGSVQRSGAKIAFGSDWSVSSANPLDGIEVAVTRLDPWGETDQPLGSNEEVSLADAIAYYTINAAYVNFLDSDSGSIEVGKLADLVVLDRNLFQVAPAEINEVKVTATLFAGKLVYGSLN